MCFILFQFGSNKQTKMLIILLHIRFFHMISSYVWCMLPIYAYIRLEYRLSVRRAILCEYVKLFSNSLLLTSVFRTQVFCLSLSLSPSSLSAIFQPIQFKLYSISRMSFSEQFVHFSVQKLSFIYVENETASLF